MESAKRSGLRIVTSPFIFASGAVKIRLGHRESSLANVAHIAGTAVVKGVDILMVYLIMGQTQCSMDDHESMLASVLTFLAERGC